MIKIVQVIGKPCTGKSTFLRKFAARNLGWQYFDIVNFRKETEDFLYAENRLLKKIINSGHPQIIIESAHGFWELDSINIKFECSLKDLKENHNRRGLELNDTLLEYYSQLESIGVLAHATILLTNSLVYEHIEETFFKVIEKIENSKEFI